MSRKYKTVERITTHQWLEQVTCDLCGATGKGEDWGSSTWEVNETTIEITVHHKEGESYPEAGWGTEYTIDLCPTCFVNRLVPWLRSQGAKIEAVPWEW